MLTTDQSPLVKGASGAPKKPTTRWVKVQRAFGIGGKFSHKVGDVIELEARLAAELITSNKVLPVDKPIVAPAAPAAAPATAEALTSDGKTPSGLRADGQVSGSNRGARQSSASTAQPTKES